MNFAGTDLTTKGLEVLRISGQTYMPQINSPLQPILNKAIVFTSTLQSRIIKVSVVVKKDSEADLKTALDDLMLILNPQLGEQTLYLDWPNALRYYTAKLTDMSDWDTSGGNFALADLTFTCADPMAYSTTQVDEDTLITSDTQTVTTTPGGSAIIRPVITITFTANDTITIENTDTGESVVFDTDGAAGSIVIDSDGYTVTGDVDGGFTGQLPRLLPGQLNTLTIKNAYGASNGNCNITYRDAYL